MSLRNSEYDLSVEMRNEKREGVVVVALLEQVCRSGVGLRGCEGGPGGRGDYRRKIRWEGGRAIIAKELKDFAVSELRTAVWRGGIFVA